MNMFVSLVQTTQDAARHLQPIFFLSRKTPNRLGVFLFLSCILLLYQSKLIKFL